jgi:hypothetical protein
MTGKQGHEGAEADVIPLHPGVGPVDIDGIGHGLEGIERDADGQLHAQRLKSGQGRQETQRLDNQIGVFKENKDAEIDGDIDCQNCLGLAANGPDRSMWMPLT